MTTIYHYDQYTFQYVGSSTAKQDPRNPSRLRIPRFAVSIEPLQPQEGKYVKFNTVNNEWYYEDIPEPEPESEPIPTPDLPQ